MALSVSDGVRLARRRRAIKHFLAWAIWAVRFEAPAWRRSRRRAPSAAHDVGAKLDARYGQYGQSGQPLFNRYLTTVIH